MSVQNSGAFADRVNSDVKMLKKIMPAGMIEHLASKLAIHNQREISG